MCYLAAITFVSYASSDSIQPALAFDNAVPNNYKMPKSNGPKPTNLGLDKRGLLRACLKPSPNCFSTTPDSLTATTDDADDELDGVEDIHVIPKWKYEKGDIDEAFRLIGKVLENYEPGQSNIDGGGFKVFERNEKNRYYYVQFESLKRGYIDDLEIAVNTDASVQVVSSSRLGYLDFQVNAKRLNYLANKLRALGFSAPEITGDTHAIYFDSNVVWEGPGLGAGKIKY